MQKKRITLLMCLAFLVYPNFVKAEPEEPDFAFITGGPYTQGENVIQFIQSNNLANSYGGPTVQRDLTSALRTEWGFTDNLEADLIVPYRSQWTKTSGLTTNQKGLGDTTFGLRYRFLREDFFPFTITFGPQVIIPTGDVEGGISNGQFGFAWDLSLAREWNPLFFNYASLNYSTTPGVNDPTASSTKEFVLHNLTWGVAPTFRVLEKDSSRGGHHDIHLYLEGAGTVSQSITVGTLVGSKTTGATYLIAPGFRYGYLSKTKTLTEVGISTPIGLTDNTPDWGIIFQVQLEQVF